jgi:uncharacterized protein (DUF2235 family)
MARNIVVCFDGTNNEYGPNNTNVVRLYEWLERDLNARDGTQIAFYDPGVGTFSIFGASWIAQKISTWIGKTLGSMFGYGLHQNIEDGYEYLMNNYLPGDRIYIFGFSRGAFTARCLAGLITTYGLLQKGSKNLIPYLMAMYHQGKHRQEGQAEIVDGFSDAFCHDVRVHFLGVWDTVASIGYLWRKKFHDEKLSPKVAFAYQAMAIDEFRRKFPVSCWDAPNAAPDEERAVLEELALRKPLSRQIVQQVWFAGAHCDVGGSYEDKGLSDIGWVWMMDKAAACGLVFADNPRGLPLKWHDDTSQNIGGKLHDESVRWKWIWMGRRRRAVPDSAYVHKSVQDRIDSNSKYRPRNLDTANLATTYKIAVNPNYSPTPEASQQRLQTQAAIPASQKIN